MTREQEIKEARHEWYLRTQDADFCAGFQKGAEWADAHNEGLNMHIKYLKEELIDKACEWLEEFMQMTPSKKTFLKRFRQAMEGE